MAIEFETRFLDIDKHNIISKLKKLGAKLEFSNLFRRYVFDIDSNSQTWIRLRDEGHRVTLTYKSRTNNSITGTEEHETIVDNFETTATILKKIPFKNIFYQENKRTEYRFNDIEFCIDEWPKIPPHLEIESYSEEKVNEGIKLLKLENKPHSNNSIVDVYKHHGIDLHNEYKLKF
jgi:adenylate cyclase class 2